MPMDTAVPRLEVRDVRKQYPGTLALDGVTLRFMGGQVHALLGKNGAGKSTVVKIIAGAVQPTSGQVLVEGHEVSFRSPGDAFAHGIATVYQELSLVPEMTVAENILFGRLPRRGIAIDWPEVFRAAQKVLDDLQTSIDVRAKVGSLGVASQQIVEIAKAMSFEPKVLLLDEPTSALAQEETDALFALVRRLTARSVAVIYISHRLQELKHIADVMSVLRDGKLVGTSAMEDATPAGIARLIFGECISRERGGEGPVGAETVLEVRGLNRKNQLHDISFSLRAGEVLGIAGMLGAGRTELLMSLFGAEAFDSGEIIIGGEHIAHPTPQRMKARGLGFAPEDRKRQGLIQMLSIEDNMVLSSLGEVARGGVLSRRKQTDVVQASVRDLQIKAGDTKNPVSSLSGGNQQKVVLGKWLNTDPKILLLDEPTRGIDVHAKRQIFEIVWKLSREGISTIFVSSELEELVEVCHRVLIMREGRLEGEVNPAEVSVERLLELCMGES